MCTRAPIAFRFDSTPTFFFHAEDGIRYLTVTGVQTCALPICFYYTITHQDKQYDLCEMFTLPVGIPNDNPVVNKLLGALHIALGTSYYKTFIPENVVLERQKIGRASCRERE